MISKKVQLVYEYTRKLFLLNDTPEFGPHLQNIGFCLHMSDV